MYPFPLLYTCYLLSGKYAFCYVFICFLFALFISVFSWGKMLVFTNLLRLVLYFNIIKLDF